MYYIWKKGIQCTYDVAYNLQSVIWKSNFASSNFQIWTKIHESIKSTVHGEKQNLNSLAPGKF